MPVSLRSLRLCDILFYMLINCHHEIFTNQFFSITNDFVTDYHLELVQPECMRGRELIVFFLSISISSSSLSPASSSCDTQEFKWGNNFNILNVSRTLLDPKSKKKKELSCSLDILLHISFFSFHSFPLSDYSIPFGRYVISILRLIAEILLVHHPNSIFPISRAFHSILFRHALSSATAWHSQIIVLKRSDISWKYHKKLIRSDKFSTFLYSFS